MITGFNTDIDFNDRVYHVQTEDRGLANPIVETLVYTGGEIVTSRKTSYAELIDSGTCDEAELLKRMESQHADLIREIRGGEFDEDEARPFGHSIVTNRSFDEVVIGFLEEHVAPEPIELAVSGPEILQEGGRPILVLQVLESVSGRPVCGARVVVRLVATGSPSKQLFAAPTDDEGRVEATFDIPNLPGANSAIVCEASSEGRTVELTRLVKKIELSP